MLLINRSPSPIFEDVLTYVDDRCFLFAVNHAVHGPGSDRCMISVPRRTCAIALRAPEESILVHYLYACKSHGDYDVCSSMQIAIATQLEDSDLEPSTCIVEIQTFGIPVSILIHWYLTGIDSHIFNSFFCYWFIHYSQYGVLSSSACFTDTEPTPMYIN